MAGDRHYPPAVKVHRPGCDSLPAGFTGEALTTRQIAEQHPNGIPHSCYHFTINPTGVIETVHYPPHSHTASTIFPDDAVHALCTTCRGTHEGETLGPHAALTIVNKPMNSPQSLLLPGKPGRIVLPGGG